MKFKDIIEGRRVEPFSGKQLELIDRGLKWNSPTDFYTNDLEGYEDSKTYGVYKYLSFKWAKIPKSQEELVRIGQFYRNGKDFRDHDKQNAILAFNDKEVWNKIKPHWSENHYDKKTEEFIQKSQKQYGMPDPNRPGHLIPRFNYDKLREVGIDVIDVKMPKIPIGSLHCNLHNIDFPVDNPTGIGQHLRPGRERSGCPLCRRDFQKLNAEVHHPKITKDEWVEKFIKNTANQYPTTSKYSGQPKYDYTDAWLSFRETEKRGTETIIHNIKCKIHNEFFAKDGIMCKSHVAGQSGCSKCNGSESIGEDRLNSILVDLYGQDNVKKQEKNVSALTFKGGQLRFDRYVNINGSEIYFEFDGSQHFRRSVKFHKDMINFYEGVARDIIKNNYCQRNNIKLIRIGYADSNNMEIEIKNALENPSQMVLSSRYPQLGWNTPDMKNNDPYLYRYLKQFKVIEESGLKLMNLI